MLFSLREHLHDALCDEVVFALTALTLFLRPVQQHVHVRADRRDSVRDLEPGQLDGLIGMVVNLGYLRIP